MTQIHIIAAIGKNRELGKKNGLIWSIPDDLKRFKELTMGHPIIMGRKTHESIGRVLPGRMNIVVSRDTQTIPGCITVESVRQALAYPETKGIKDVFVIGGAQVYTEAIHHATRLYLTRINATDPEADVFFPEYDDFTKVIDREEKTWQLPGSDSILTYEWVTLERE